MRQQIGEAGEAFPLGGGGGKAAVEAGVYDEVGTRRVRERPEVSGAVGAGERLSKVPELAGEGVAPEAVRDGEGLAELRAADAVAGLLGDDAVDVEVQPGEVIAEEDERGLAGRADVDVRRGALMDAAEVAEADGGAASGARKRDGLCAGENIAGMRAGEFVARRAGAVSEGLGDEQQLQAGRDGELRDLTDAEGTCDIRRVCGVE